MPLPLPNLDDKTFEVMVDEATKLIPRESPEWTDHNRHDPGITLVELFAWLAEMQQYYLNRVRQASYLKFLKLLGISPRGAALARAELSFALPAGASQSVTVPQGSRLAAAKLPFETAEPLVVVPAALKKVLTSSPAGVVDNTEANSITGLSFLAFGAQAEARSRMYLGFDQPLPAGQRISLTFNLFEQYPVERGAHGDEPTDITPSALIIWEYYDGATWAPLDLFAIIEPLLATATGGAPDREPICRSLTRELRALLAGPNVSTRLPPGARDYIEQLIEAANTIGDLRGMLADSELLRLNQDETLMLTRGGRLFFTAPAAMGRKTIDPFPERLFWLRATVRQPGYELPPRVDDVAINTVPVIQRETSSEVLAFSGSGEPGQSVTASSYLLSLAGSKLAPGKAPEGIQVQVRESDGLWSDWEAGDLASAGANDRRYRIKRAASGITITFGDDTHGRAPPAGAGNIRLIAYLPSFSQRRLIGRSDGLPGQRFSFGQAGILDDLSIQVEEPVREDGGVAYRWRDWIRVDDFDASGPDDAHFMLIDTNSIQFGDGVNGAIPRASDETHGKNIRAIVYRAGGGADGNVLAGTIARIVQPIGDMVTLTATNRRPASGGGAAPTLEALETAARRDLQTPYQAVTSDDYELLARATPGLRVARARAIPLFAPGTRGYPEQRVEAAVTVVVVPYSLAARPTPSRGFLQTVCRHLDRHRLITTSVAVIPPDYVQVSVQAALLLRAGFSPASVRTAIEGQLNAFLHPLTGGPDGGGWPFGRTVYKSEIYQLIETIDGVDCVERVTLTAAGAGIARDAEGNVLIPPQSLVVAGTHRIDITSPDPACR